MGLIRKSEKSEIAGEVAKITDELQGCGVVTDGTREAVELIGRNHARRFNKWRRNVIVGYIVILVGAGWTFADVQNQQANQDQLTKRLATLQAIGQARDTHTRSVVCLILQQGDTATYEYAERHQITAEELVKALDNTAAYRAELGPAPHCVPTPTKQNELEPFGRPASPKTKGK